MNTFVVLVSITLMIYWFRYMCLLVLRTRRTRNYANSIAEANQLSFLRVQRQLAEGGEVSDKLHMMLDRDYELLQYMLRNGANFRRACSGFEQKLLQIDYWSLRLMYSLSRMLGLSEGRQALSEMAEIISHMAHNMGETAALATVR